MLLCHCGQQLTPVNSKSGIIYECKKCSCIYRFILVHSSDECFEKEHGKKLIPIPEEIKKKRKPRKKKEEEQE